MPRNRFQFYELNRLVAGILLATVVVYYFISFTALSTCAIPAELVSEVGWKIISRKLSWASSAS